MSENTTTARVQDFIVVNTGGQDIIYDEQSARDLCNALRKALSDLDAKRVLAEAEQ